MIANPGPSGRRRLPALVAIVFLGLAVAAALLLARDADSPSRLQLLLGRLHPLVVHLPIGFLLLAFVLEVASRWRPLRRVRPSLPLVLALSAASAVGAVLAGYLLAAGGGYAGPTVVWHQRLGIGVALAALVAMASWFGARHYRRPWLRRVYEGSLFAAVGLMVVTGHLGGTLTRGPDYLSEYLPRPLRSALAHLPGERTTAATFGRIDEARIYDDLVRPVLQARCASCHGAEVQKGGLRLDSPEGIRKGGRSGHTVVAGRADESELVRRLWLPPDHEDAMPPRGRRPLAVVEAELIRWWIDRGASFEQTVAEVDPPSGVLALLEHLAGPQEARLAPVLRTRVAAADSAAVRQARLLGVAITPLADGTGFLRAHCRTGAAVCGSAQVEALLPLAEQLAVLDLGGAGVTDPDLAAVGRLRHLTRLHLERTRITDAGLAHLDSLDHLEYLNLYGTAVTDAGLERLAGLGNLRALFLWQSAATPAGAQRLREQRATLRIDLGLDPTALDSLRTTALGGSAEAPASARGRDRR